MAQDKNVSAETNKDATERMIETEHNPNASLEKARNAAAGQTPNAAGSTSPSTAEDHIPSNSEPEASDLPSAR